MDVKRMRLPDFAARKRQGEKIVMLTAYDATMARLLDRAGVDALLVGDSLGMVILGLETTLPVTLDADRAPHAGGRRGADARLRHRRHALPDVSGQRGGIGAQRRPPAAGGRRRCRQARGRPAGAGRRESGWSTSAFR